ncbi:MAG TPA: hypothetical protein VNC50_18780 [Planctomycetia bacterium]|nr:hypothetical protein [Planctomycetia bacterium]
MMIRDTGRILFAAALLAPLVGGCGGASAPRARASFDETEREKVAAHLAAAGVAGEVAAIRDVGDLWSVTVVQSAPATDIKSADGASRSFEPVRNYDVRKSDGAVIKPQGKGKR